MWPLTDPQRAQMQHDDWQSTVLGRYRGVINAYWERSYLRTEWQCDHAHDDRDAAAACAHAEYDRQVAAGERSPAFAYDEMPYTSQRRRWLEDQC